KLHAGYDDDYPQEIRKGREALRDLIGVDAPEGSELWRAIMGGNAKRIIDSIDWTEATGER
ncbi:MAG: hypothetical protein AAFY88_30945, partial [Acidobacteriota bacterium]